MGFFTELIGHKDNNGRVTITPRLWFAARIQRCLWERNKDFIKIRFWFHGVAYIEPWSDTYVVVLWPFNIIVGFARWMSRYLRHSPFINKDLYTSAYHNGYSEGYYRAISSLSLDREELTRRLLELEKEQVTNAVIEQEIATAELENRQSGM